LTRVNGRDGWKTGSRAGRPLALVTGGAGFVGTNVADRLLREGRRVRIFDSLARRGADENLRWLLTQHPRGVEVERADVRDREALRRAVTAVQEVYHFAAQVAVTTSVAHPWHDFEVNLYGTVQLLDELRQLPEPPSLLFTSTNKVYGSLPDLELVRRGDRWEPVDSRLRSTGIGEQQPLDFCTPYGCSKGAADQYVLDCAKTYGIPGVVLRMSCIYGPHQHGTEDQGWVGHFLLRALADRPITIYGDGAQTRDILFVDDLVRAMLLVQDRAHDLSGTTFNVGGGPECAVSLLDVIDLIEEVVGRRPRVSHDATRIGDQLYYVSDTSRLEEAVGWTPTVLPEEGIGALHRWLVTRRLDAPARQAR
jgi:CDP-paratose 2-epimerase